MTTTMNTGAASLSDEQIEALKAAALAATPQDIDGAQRIDRYEDGSQILCPACGGEGYVELNTDFCNYDGEALGVQFYGIGNAHALAEAYFRAAKPATVLALIERLERAEATPAQQADAAPSDDGLIPRPDLERDPLWQWRCIANEAEVVVNHKGKFLMLNEEMCVRLGAALEDAAIAAGGAQEAGVFEWLETEVSAVSCRYHGDPSYDHDAYWMKDRVMKLIADARKAFPLPREAATVLSEAELERVAEEIMKGMRAIGLWEHRKTFAVRVMREAFAAPAASNGAPK